MTDEPTPAHPAAFLPEHSSSPTLLGTIAVTAVPWGVGAAASHYLGARHDLLERLQTDISFAHTGFRNGEFKNLAHTAPARKSGIFNNVFRSFQNSIGVDNEVTTILKDGGVTRWEAVKNLSSEQRVVPLVIFAAATVGLGAWNYHQLRQAEQDVPSR